MSATALGALTTSRWRVVGALALVIAASVLLPHLSTRFGRRVLLDLGPNDDAYVSGFRPEWERDLATRFHWTTPSAQITLPLRLAGSGHVLRMRMRRHFVDPAHVRLRVEGQTVASFDLAADTVVPYQVRDYPLPRLRGDHPFVLAIDAPSDAGRPLGIALDWIELHRDPGATLQLLPQTRLRIVLASTTVFLLLLIAGVGTSLALGAGLVTAVASAGGIGWDIVAAERILRLGTPALVIGGLAAALLVALPWSRTALQVDTRRTAGLLVALVLVALAVRLVLMLHPQFYYPDVKIHALFAWQLLRRGIMAFMQEFTANQFRYSLGLQFENGHWYAFPYPPAFYVLAQPLLWLGHRPETAVALLAALVNSLEALVVFGIARALRRTTAVALGAAAAVTVLPIFLARLCLAYFPALVGHAVDAILILFLLRQMDQLHRPRRVIQGALLLALALLAYTQAVLNFALILGLFLLVQVARDRSREGRQRQAGLLVMGILGVVMSLGFYGRYIPVFLDMQAGRPQPDEGIVLEKLARTRVVAEEVTAPEVDPYAGPRTDLGRGMRKAAWRLWVFYGPWAPAVVLGVLLVARNVRGARGQFVAVWAMSYVLLNLASGGLPGPNLVRYNKDLEVVAPLVCVGLGLLAAVLASRSRRSAWIFWVLFFAFGLVRATTYLTATFSRVS